MDRVKLRRYFVFFICILGLILHGSLSAFAMEASGDAQAPEKKILRFGLHTSGIGHFDPDFGRSSEDLVFADMVFNSLLRYAPGDASRLEADLAREIPQFVIRRGRQIWTVHLRKGVFFHESPHGEAYELTAEDVVFSLEKAADPDRSAYSAAYEGMTFTRLDSYSLEISIQKPMSPLFFLPLIANWRAGFILSKKAVESSGYEAFTRHPVGTGPFAFVSYTPGDKLTLRGHGRYFRGKPGLEQVEIRFIPDNDRREQAFRSGDLDVIYGVGDPGWVTRMEKEPGTIVDVFGPGYTGLLHFNTSIKPLDDIRVRKAIAHALDRDGFMAGSSTRLTTRVTAPMSNAFLPGGLDNETVSTLGLSAEHDVEKSRQLLSQAGYGQGFPLEIVTSKKRLYRKNYTILKEQLERVGIQVNLKVVPHSRMHKLIRQNINPLVFYFTFRPNADSYLRGFFHSDSIVKTGLKPHTNFSHYKSVDKLLDNALETTNPQQQICLWEQAQIRLLHDRVVYPLYTMNQCVVRRDYVRYGHELDAVLAGYPQFNERTSLSSQHFSSPSP